MNISTESVSPKSLSSGPVASDAISTAPVNSESLPMNQPIDHQEAERAQTQTDDHRVAAEPSASLLFLDHLTVGDQWTSQSREVTAEDVAEFAVLTGDEDPLHTDDSGGSPFGEPVAHGLLGLSVLAGLSSQKPKVATLALVGISDWSFDAPIYFGDSVRVRTTVESIEQHGRRAGRVTWMRQLINQQDRVVQQGRFVSLVATMARSKQFANSNSKRPLPAR